MRREKAQIRDNDREIKELRKELQANEIELKKTHIQIHEKDLEIQKLKNAIQIMEESESKEKTAEPIPSHREERLWELIQQMDKAMSESLGREQSIPDIETAELTDQTIDSLRQTLKSKIESCLTSNSGAEGSHIEHPSVENLSVVVKDFIKDINDLFLAYLNAECPFWLTDTLSLPGQNKRLDDAFPNTISDQFPIKDLQRFLQILFLWIEGYTITLKSARKHFIENTISGIEPHRKQSMRDYLNFFKTETESDSLERKWEKQLEGCLKQWFDQHIQPKIL